MWYEKEHKQDLVAVSSQFHAKISKNNITSLEFTGYISTGNFLEGVYVNLDHFGWVYMSLLYFGGYTFVLSCRGETISCSDFLHFNQIVQTLDFHTCVSLDCIITWKNKNGQLHLAQLNWTVKSVEDIIRIRIMFKCSPTCSLNFWSGEGLPLRMT